MYNEFKINNKLLELSYKIEKEIESIFKKIEKTCEYNSLKVLKAFNKYKISEVHFGTTTGYGYSDIGRDTIEKVFSEIFKSEDCIVRSQFISGTHAISTALFAFLRPGDTMLSITGKPYDTLDSVIGLTPNTSSLKSYNINYKQIDLLDNEFDIEKIEQTLKTNDIKLIAIQRSRGYSTRQSISLEKLDEIINIIRKVNKDVIIMIDNCYCEFVQEKEPIELGADIIIGSLIKNMGGGLAQNGAYIAGKKELVNLAAQRLTVPGQGKEVGPSLGLNKSILQGLFLSPSVVASSLKTAVFASKMLETLGYKVSPKYNEQRADIVQAIEFGNQEDLIKYCQGIQMASPVDSNSIPEPWDMPGYDDKIIMASGSFVSGSSIELSCDGPIRKPYIAFMQGGLTYEYGKIGVLRAITNLY